MLRKVIAFSLAISVLFPALANDANRDIDHIIKDLWKTSALKVDGRRLGAMCRMQYYIDSLSAPEFGAYCSADAATRLKMENGTALRYYHKSLEKLVREIPSTRVRPGTVAIWHLYNMGYVIKTPSRCFAVDLMHPDAGELVPYIDFLLITHRHNDHYTDALNLAMTTAGKPVYSNWTSDSSPLTNLRDIRHIEAGDISIDTDLTDHNETHPSFVITYLVDCGEDTGHIRIFFTGDSCNWEQLNPQQSVDIFVPHIHVGLDIAKAAEKIDPEWVLSSHILELGHDLKKWRWSYFTGLDVSHETHRRNVFLPVWGEKIIYKK